MGSELGAAGNYCKCVGRVEDRHALLETFLEAIRLADQSPSGEADMAKTCEDDVT